MRDFENETDHYEDVLGTYLVKLSTQGASTSNSAEAAGLLKLIGDFERIADHAVNLVEAAEELNLKELEFSEEAVDELSVIFRAVEEVFSFAKEAFMGSEPESALRVESLEEVIDDLKEELRSRHIRRLQCGKCSIEVGFVWADLLTGLERISDHCSNIAVCIIDMARNNMNQHEAMKTLRSNNAQFAEGYVFYSEKYALPKE